MNDEVKIAFAHPAVRAEVTAGDEPRDRISLRDCIREVEIGAFQQERGARQRLRFNVVVEVAGKGAALADDVDRVVSYDAIAVAIDAELAGERLNLLETLAERVAARILREPRALRVFVRVEKLDRAPAALGVEIVRTKSDPRTRALAGIAASREAAPPVQLVHLSNAAIAAPELAAFLDRLAGGEVASILCVGLPDGSRPRASGAVEQRRIDLLAVDQNAWVLAARDRRCVVADSRTELEWALRHGVMSVWAPSRIVLGRGAAEEDDAVPAVADGVALARWLAVSLATEKLMLVGGPPPGGAGLTTRFVDPKGGAGSAA